MKGDEFIREVDEAVRQDRWMTLWKTYGTYVVGGVVAVVLGTTAGVGWREWQERARLAQAERYAEASRLLEQDRPAEAVETLAAVAADSGDGYAVLARLRLAEAQAAAGDREAARATLEALARDEDAGRLYRQLSELLLLQRGLQQIGPDEALERAEQLTREDAPWRYSALELKALAELQAGETSAARATLNSLVTDPAVPGGINRRASELLQALGGPLENEAPGGGAGPS